MLDAAISNSAVRPPNPDLAVPFAREAALGRAPMGEAYGQLAELVPDLINLETQVRLAADRRRDEIPPGTRELADIRKQAARLLGPQSRHGAELVRSNMALSIAQRYLYATAGYDKLGNADTPYFAAPNTLRSTIHFRHNVTDSRDR
jgi:hypothetical protein